MDGRLALALLCLVAAAYAQDDPCEGKCTAAQSCVVPTEAEKQMLAVHHLSVPLALCIDPGFKVGTCAMEHIQCNQYANCTEGPNNFSFNCECPPHSVGDGFESGSGCTLEYRVCANDFDCPQYASCSEDHKCECDPGFEGDPKVECTDIVDCPHESCDENAICTDIPGSFKCVCDGENGYYGDGETCFYRCHGDQDCHIDAKCKNDVCVCNNGYKGDGKKACHDVAECSDPNNNNCHKHATCVEEKGGYTCKCNNGYRGTGFDCKKIPRDCQELAYPKGFASGRAYWIDPDFTGPAMSMKVFCGRAADGTIFTVVKPKWFPKKVVNPEPGIKYYSPERDLKAFVDNMEYCTQDAEFTCGKGFAMMPGTKWTDAHGVTHKSWGSNNDNECSCGAIGACKDGCKCDGTRKTGEYMVSVDKNELPITGLKFDQKEYFGSEIKSVGWLKCARRQFDIPKDCHDAKKRLGKKTSGPYYIDPDGRGGAKPFLVNCDMTSFPHVGITQINPANTRIEQGPVKYNQNDDQIKALLDNSKFCSQRVEYRCRNAPLLGNSGAGISGPKGPLNYFAGANGKAGSCGCGATQSCDSREVTCNCQIQDGKQRKDFGLIINKADLPVTSTQAKMGADSGSMFVVSGLECAQNQFGIEPNCEKYRSTQDIYEDHTYFVDPDGPYGLKPFPAECKFEVSPPYGNTIIHHTDEVPKFNPDTLTFDYPSASPEQIEALRKRSTSCSQAITVGCHKYSLKYDGKAATWQTANGQTLELARSMESCALDGTLCKCQQGAERASDDIFLIEKEQVPARSMDFTRTNGQLKSELTITVGPLVCGEIFPTCVALKKYLNENNLVGENEVVNGKFTIDPDGVGGVDPFMVNCQFPMTKIPLVQGDNNGGLTSPDPNADPNAPFDPLNDKCFPIQYKDPLGNPISPEQITALAQASDECTQTLEIECQYAKASGRVNYTSCAGDTYKGVASYGGEKEAVCPCGLFGNCEGGKSHGCNCDMNDKKKRTDGGSIIETDRLPICEVCVATENYPPGTPKKDIKPRSLKYNLGALVCDSKQGGASGQTCQQARRKYPGRVPKKGVEVGIIGDIDGQRMPLSCRYTQTPPIGELVTKPKDPVIPPTPGPIVPKYITVNMNWTQKAMEKNEYCTQTIYLYGAKDKNVDLDGQTNYWWDFNEVKHSDWEELPTGHAEVTAGCKANNGLCKKFGKPRAFKIREKTNLPVAGIVLAESASITTVVGEATCLDLLRSCQEVAETTDNCPNCRRWKGFVGGIGWVIDPDQAGDSPPFRVDCHLDYPGKNGVSEVKTNGKFKQNKQLTIKNKKDPRAVTLPVVYKNVNHKQIEELTKISDFCWQTVQVACKNSPIFTPDGNNNMAIRTFNGHDLKAFGAANDTKHPGCMCDTTGTCKSEGVCHCDSGKSTKEVASISNEKALPITALRVGGNPGGEAKIKVNSVRCSKRPMEPRRDCSDMMKMPASEYNIQYRKSGEYLISPKPYDPEIKAFNVYCDVDMVPGQGITVIHPKPRQNLAEPVPEDGKVKMAQQTKETLPEGATTYDYYAPSIKQIKALVDRSKYCYQLVKMECQDSPIFGDGSYWTSLHDDTTPRKVWGGAGKMNGMCACGMDNSCAGTDSSEAQHSRKCNCEIADGVKRADAGVVTAKQFLPIGQYVKGSQGAMNLTVGPIYCSDKKIPLNECTLGFHDCHKQAECVDTKESFKCFCKEGWQGKGTIVDESSPRANGRQCIDDNECTWDPCPNDAICTNEPGSFNCTCKRGFRQLAPMECEDIDECAEGSHNCHADADCKNLHGSYECRCKAGYRGDGYDNCVPVGQCFCFGDPHLISFDDRWIHHQGDCEYVMTQDGCPGTGHEQTFRVHIEHWSNGMAKPGYYGWVKAVHVFLPKLGFNVTLHQENGVTVNGEKIKQFHEAHIMSIAQILDKTIINVVTGLEVVWDGMDIIEINVPIGDVDRTCGLCGNFNAKQNDDWTMGPSCSDKQGQITDNYDLMGRSWMALNTPKQCKKDCGDQKPTLSNPPPRCEWPLDSVSQKCEQLFGTTEDHPFAECMRAHGQSKALEEFRFSCMMDGCYEEHNLGDRICHFAKAVFEHCQSYMNIKTEGWRAKVTACQPIQCEAPKVYKSCGSIDPPTCLNHMVKTGSISSKLGASVCGEGCYCPDGMVEEEGSCVLAQDCGCFWDGEYLVKGETVVVDNCTKEIICKGNNITETVEMECMENMECGLNTTSGKMGCVCVVEYVWDHEEQICVPDDCYQVECVVEGAVCVEGVCVCKPGFEVDCGVCVDIDECAIGTAENCHGEQGFECINTPGSYECDCKEGLVRNGSICTDVDECETVTDKKLDCGPKAACVNYYGTAVCECCGGFELIDGECVRDPTQELAPECCNCVGAGCGKPGKVCATDGHTYESYRHLKVDACRKNKTVEINYSYDGPCQSDCTTVICDKVYSNCTMDAGHPVCECPTCENITSFTETDMVCAKNKVSYISICHMNKDLCTANVETEVEVEMIGQPCPQNETETPIERANPWGPWSECSEQCQQGIQTRTRETNDQNGLENIQTQPCYRTCEQGPCTPETCPTPGSVCIVEGNSTETDTEPAPECGCPNCTAVKSPICGRVGYYVSTFDNECSMLSAACLEGEPDYEMLEEQACEQKPKGCGRVRNFKVYEDENGCKADREVDHGYCYGGCAEDASDETMCCAGVKFEYDFAILTCPPDATHAEPYKKNKFMKRIKECQCKKTAELKGEEVGHDPKVPDTVPEMIVIDAQP